MAREREWPGGASKEGLGMESLRGGLEFWFGERGVRERLGLDGEERGSLGFCLGLGGRSR